MSQRLKNLYTHLIDNRKHQLIGWYSEYKRFSEDIDRIRINLKSNILRDKDTYIGTSFQNSTNPFEDFVKKLLYDQSNGISSRGQSVLSGENLIKFRQSDGFDDIIKNLIISYDSQSLNELRTWWEKQNVGNRPVLINRAISACTQAISSTVDEGKFYQIFYWLQNESLIPDYPKDEPQDWFHRNIFLVKNVSDDLEDVPDIDKYWINIFIWEMYVNISNPFNLKKQIVKYGSPGTGKTYSAKQNTKLLFQIWKDEFAGNNTFFDFNNQIETVQFHPSYTYEDFLEGLRPKLDVKGQAQLILQNGIFKEFCIDAGKWERDIFNLKIRYPHLNSWKELKIQDLELIKTDLDKEYWSYILDVENKNKNVADAVPPYFFIIDEINRAELSRVFGELMYCLEYRGTMGAVKTQYSHLNDSETGMIKVGDGYQFFIPENVYIIGTMNTIDRSVESFDFALRRRFRWEEVMPDTTLLYYHLLKHNRNWTSLAENLKNLNEEIEKEPLLGRDFQIGHAYLWDLHYSKELPISQVKNAIWEDSIAPLLQEYLRGTGREDLLDKFAKKFGVNL